MPPDRYYSTVDRGVSVSVSVRAISVVGVAKNRIVLTNINADINADLIQTLIGLSVGCLWPGQLANRRHSHILFADASFSCIAKSCKVSDPFLFLQSTIALVIFFVFIL